MKIDKEDYNDGYYHISQDIKKYPEATVYIVWSHRGPGKTYSALRYPYHKFRTLYMKRTNKDISTICEFAGDIDFDPSPWKPLNRDFGINVKPRLIKDGIGAFYDVDEEGNPAGAVINYVASLNALKALKGMDFSDIDWLIFDEFIPLAGEVVKKAEGEMLLDLYETLSRDRIKRGRDPLKLILFANAEEISTHITNALEVVDTMAEMQARHQHEYYDKERTILFHHLTEKEYPVHGGENSGMMRVMRGTAWAEKAYGGDFSQNDFSNVQELTLKGMKCMYHLHYRRRNDAYIYLNPRTGVYYMTNIKGKPIQSYNLDRENDQKKFFMEHGVDLREKCINDMFKFRRYSYYDLIINYTKFYDL